MRQSEIIELYAYNRWANARILNTAMGIDDAQFCAPLLPGLPSLRHILAHAYGAEWIWRKRCEEGFSPVAMPSADEFPNVDALYTLWMPEQETMRAYVGQLSNAQLEEKMAYRTTSGNKLAAPLWQVLLHVVNHGTQHRAEAAAVLTALGRSPGHVDLIVYVRQQQAAGHV